MNSFQIDDYDSTGQDSYFGNKNKNKNNIKILPNQHVDTLQLNAMRAGGWIPTNGLVKEDPTLPYNLTLHKASLGMPTVNKALFNQFPQQPWDIDPNALCNVPIPDNGLVSGSASKSIKGLKDRAERSGWNLLTPTRQELEKQSLPGDIQARYDGAAQTNQGRLQDRRLLTQDVTRASPSAGFAYGTSAVPLAYENLNFATTEPPVGLDNCEPNDGYSFMDSDNLGFAQVNDQKPKWNQGDMGGINDDTGKIFPYQGNTRYLMSHKDPISGKTYQVYGRDPLLENSGKVYDEIPSRRLGIVNRRVEEMMGNRRLTSPMPNKSDMPNMTVIPDKQGLARGEYEAARRMDEQRFAKSTFFQRDNEVRPPPPQAARTSTGNPYTGFVGLREMARYNNVNEPSMKEPEFAARKYDVHIAPQTNVKINSHTVPELKQTFYVAGLGSSSVANTIDPVGANTVFTAKPGYFNQLPDTDIQAGQFINDYNHLSGNRLVNNNGLDALSQQMNGMDYTPENYDMNPATALHGKFVNQTSNLNSLANASVLTDRELGTDTSFINNNGLLASGKGIVNNIGMNPQLFDRNQEQNYDMNEYNQVQTNITAPVQNQLFETLRNDSSSSINTVSGMTQKGGNVNAMSAKNFNQLPSIDDFTPKDDLNAMTRLAYLGNSNVFMNNLHQLDVNNENKMPDILNTNVVMQTNLSAQPGSFSQMDSQQFWDDKDYMNFNTVMQSNIKVPTASNAFLPDRDYENINGDIMMDTNHNFTPTFGHGGMTSANYIPKLTDNGQVDNDRVIPYDWLAGSRRVQENVEYMKDSTLPANFRDIPDMDKEPYLSDLRTYQEIEAAKYKNNEESTRTLRQIVSDAQADAFAAYQKKRALRKSMPRNPESDTDTDCDISK